MNIPNNIRNLRLALELIETAYHDLKNVPSFRESDPDPRIVAIMHYEAARCSVQSLIRLAEKAAKDGAL